MMKTEIEKIVLLTKEGRKYLKENRIKVIGSQRGIEKNKKFFQSVISDWERGKHNPSLLKLKEYLRILKRKTNLLKNLLKSYKRHKTSPKIVQVLLPEMKKLKEIGLSYHEIARVINKNQSTSISWTTFQNRLKNFGE